MLFGNLPLLQDNPFPITLGFGFCEYADPESTLRALRLLHDLKLGEKALVVSTAYFFSKGLLRSQGMLLLGEGRCKDAKRPPEVPHHQKT